MKCLTLGLCCIFAMLSLLELAETSDKVETIVEMRKRCKETYKMDSEAMYSFYSTSEDPDENNMDFKCFFKCMFEILDILKDNAIDADNLTKIMMLETDYDMTPVPGICENCAKQFVPSDDENCMASFKLVQCMIIDTRKIMGPNSFVEMYAHKKEEQ